MTVERLLYHVTGIAESRLILFLTTSARVTGPTKHIDGDDYDDAEIIRWHQMAHTM